VTHSAYSPRPQRTGFLVAMVGPAGAGKNQLMNDVINRYQGQMPVVRQFPTATTRPIREYEQDGREHHFVSVERFKHMIAHNELIEYQQVHGTERYYGMPRETLELGLEAGEVLIADIEYLGALRVKELYPDHVITVFIMPPSVSALIERMRIRNTEDETEISKRLLRVPAEVNFASQCDYLIINDAFDYAARLLNGVIAGEINRRNKQSILASTMLGKFEYIVRVVAVGSDNQVLNTSDLTTASAPLNYGTPPFEVAVALARSAFEANLDVSRMVTGDRKPDDEYIPPMQLTYERLDKGERIYFTYGYRTTPVEQPSPAQPVDVSSRG